jgi:hypothetical protein
MKAKPIHALVADAVVQFKQHHGGAAPASLTAERDALVVASREGKLGLRGIPVKVVTQVEESRLAKPGLGTALAMVLVELPGDRFGAAVLEYAPVTL